MYYLRVPVLRRKSLELLTRPLALGNSCSGCCCCCWCCRAPGPLTAPHSTPPATGLAAPPVPTPAPNKLWSLLRRVAALPGLPAEERGRAPFRAPPPPPPTPPAAAAALASCDAPVRRRTAEPGLALVLRVPLLVPGRPLLLLPPASSSADGYE